MARSTRQRQADVASNLHQAHADQAREAHSNAQCPNAKACFDQAVMCHTTAARLVARVDKLAQAAMQYRSAAAHWEARRNFSLASHLTNRADEMDVAIAATPEHADKWHNRGLEYSARGMEYVRDYNHPDHDKIHQDWLKGLNLPTLVPEEDRPNAAVEDAPRSNRARTTAPQE